MEFRILGPLEVADGDNVITLASSKQRGLLALLLLNANEVVSAERLIDALWGEHGPESGRTALQVLVSKLRKELGHAGLPLTTRAPGYVMQLEHDQLDLHRFERLVKEANAAEPAVAAGKLREALALWRGPALADLAYESFAQLAVGRLEELRIGALEKRIDADLALGRDREVVAELEELVAEHPLREGLRAQLMLALYRSGRQADALATYQAARRNLIEELGIEPSPPLRELEQAILRQDASLELASAPSPQRSVLVVPLTESKVGSLLALAAPLARRPPKELVVAQPVDDRARLSSASAALHEQRARLLTEGLAARAAAFVSNDPANDAVRMAAELDCDLLLLDAPPTLLDSPVLQALLANAPCDVAALIGSDPSPGPLLVPFVGAAHDWTAIELAAWLAGAWKAPLWLAGPSLEDRDASRLLASASLIVQRALGVAAEPRLLAPEPDELVQAAKEAALVVTGLSDRWQKEGLGTARGALAHLDRPPVLLVRRGLRPGGLAPRDSLTRFTWSVRVGPV